MSEFTVSHQQIPASVLEYADPLTAREPLADFKAKAPNLLFHRYDADNVPYPFANDEFSNAFFRQLALREHTTSYQLARNPVAFLVGESALAANIHTIPEPTIVVFDRSPDMCLFMEMYVNALRDEMSAIDFAVRLCNTGNFNEMVDKLTLQTDKWRRRNQPHPFTDDAAFFKAKETMKNKTIVTWNGNITDDEDMSELADSLRDSDAKITFMNLTNVLPAATAQVGDLEWIDNLRCLPMTDDAPILSTMPSESDFNGASLAEIYRCHDWMEQIGPHFGLHNFLLAQHDPNDRYFLTRALAKHQHRNVS